MPARSVTQREAMAIAEHHPEKLYKRNRGMLSMSHRQLHDFAKTKESGLPKRREAMKKAKENAKKRGK